MEENGILNEMNSAENAVNDIGSVSGRVILSSELGEGLNGIQDGEEGIEEAELMELGSAEVISCANLYTIQAASEAVYRVEFPSEGHICVRNAASGDITLYLDENAAANNEYIVLAEGEAFNDLYVPAGRIFISTQSDTGDVSVVFR